MPDSTDIPALVERVREADADGRHPGTSSMDYVDAIDTLCISAPVLAEEVERLRKLLSMIHRIADANNVSDEAIGGTAFKTIMKLTKEGTA